MPSNVAPRFWPEDHATVFILIENSQAMSDRLVEIGENFVPNTMSSKALVRFRSYPDCKEVVVKALADTYHVLSHLPFKHAFLDLSPQHLGTLDTIDLTGCHPRRHPVTPGAIYCALQVGNKIASQLDLISSIYIDCRYSSIPRIK